jgi:hypothetical protein
MKGNVRSPPDIKKARSGEWLMTGSLTGTRETLA